MTRDLSNTPLLGDCEGCGKPNALLDGRTGDHYCLDCARKEALYAASLEGLKLLLTETLVAWGLTWSGEFPQNELEEIAGIAVSEARGDFEQQVRVDYPAEQEDVQPVPVQQAAD